MRKNKNNETDLPLTISSKDGLVDQISFFNKTVASKDMSGYYLLLNGEYAYNKSYSVGYDFGSIKRLERYPMGALSTLYICFALKKYNSDFIKTYFDSLKWYKEIYMISAEGARNHGLLNVPTDEFFDTYHYITENEVEQEKIAKLMELIDRRIQKHQALVDNLKKYKRGVDASFFDIKRQHCEKKLYGWDCVPFGDVVAINPKTPALPERFIYIDLESVDFGRLQCLKYINRKDAPSRAQRVLADSDVLFQMVRPYQKNNYFFQDVFDSPVVASTGYAQIRCPDCDPVFVFEQISSDYFSQEAMLRSTGTGYPAINSEGLAEIPFFLPSLPEQKKIGKFLSLLRTKIENENRKLEVLNKLKTALLQQLFI